MLPVIKTLKMAEGSTVVIDDSKNLTLRSISSEGTCNVRVSSPKGFKILRIGSTYATKLSDTLVGYLAYVESHHLAIIKITNIASLGGYTKSLSDYLKCYGGTTFQALVAGAMPIEHPQYQYRNKDLLIKVTDYNIVAVEVIHCLQCMDIRRIPVFNECSVCDGSGCSKCNNKGGRSGFIPCQTCTPSKRYKPVVRKNNNNYNNDRTNKNEKFKHSSRWSSI